MSLLLMQPPALLGETHSADKSVKYLVWLEPDWWCGDDVMRW